MSNIQWEIFDTFIDGVLIFDQNRKLLYTNQAMANIVGSSLKRLKPGSLVTEFLTLNNAELFFMDGGTEGKDGPSQYKEIDYQSYKGNHGKMLVMVCPYLPIENGQSYLCFFRDMTLEVKLHDKYRAELLEKEAVNIELRKAKIELEQYSKNLEIMVQERTKELQKANQFVTAMVNSLDQGLVVFNENGDCLPNFTKAFIDIFHTSPEGKKIWEVISSSEVSTETFQTWARGIFQEIIPFKDYSALGPSKLEFEKKQIKIDYFPMRGEDDVLEGVVAVATDKTSEFLAEKEAKKNKEYVQMVLKLIQNKEQFLSFVSDSKRLLSEMELTTISLKNGENKLNDLLRHLHSIKGSAGIFSIHDVQEMAHNYETELSIYRDKPVSELQGYLPTLEANILSLSTKLKDFYQECSAFLGKSVIDGEARVEMTRIQLKSLAEKIGLEKLTPKVQEELEDIFFKEPIFKFFTSYSDLIQSMARDQGKQVYPLEFEGGDLRVKPENYAELFSTLVHAFTNAIDHGLEDPTYRAEIGKDPKGKILVRFQKLYSGPISFLQIDIQDDGRGIDANMLRTKLKEKGIVDRPELLGDHQIVQYIFAPHFSTKSEVSKTSGRGVGADAIKAQVEAMGGMVEVSSFPGKGSLLSILIPVR